MKNRRSRMFLWKRHLKIETIIKQLESPEVTLDDSFRLYQAGVEKIKTCNLLLDTVEKKMQVMQADGSLADFE